VLMMGVVGRILQVIQVSMCFISVRLSLQG
jgi:hypothetical protein